MRRNQKDLKKGGFLLEDQIKVSLGRKRWKKKVELETGNVRPQGEGGCGMCLKQTGQQSPIDGPAEGLAPCRPEGCQAGRGSVHTFMEQQKDHLPGLGSESLETWTRIFHIGQGQTSVAWECDTGMKYRSRGIKLHCFCS